VLEKKALASWILRRPRGKRKKTKISRGVLERVSTKEVKIRPLEERTVLGGVRPGVIHTVRRTRKGSQRTNYTRGGLGDQIKGDTRKDWRVE